MESMQLHVQVLQRFEKYTYVECQLETGRTHRSQVHMASLRRPLGDAVYGPAKCNHLQGQTLPVKNTWDHTSAEAN